ncbi:YtpR family tRNA-binding protein [Spiroplasma endosymbiont of Panorpa germanica]|uniref:YtpR family tRNA-binding protein n=1 Tax=Spiroplasma endosymbiont of Panorpa germanica TaxID=3066314 RepID=UPI0030D42A1B
MNFKAGIYYNDQFDSLFVILNDIDKNKSEIVENKEYTLLYKDKNLVGLNIFNVGKKLKIAPGMVSHNREVIDFVNQILAKLKQEKIVHTPQLTIVKIEKAEPISETHLNLCQVNNGQETLQIVCGAKNVISNSLAVLASIGTWMPNGMKIKASKLKGIESFGMLCSAKELELKNHNFGESGIILLDNKWEKFIGQDFLRVREEEFENK